MYNINIMFLRSIIVLIATAVLYTTRTSVDAFASSSFRSSSLLISSLVSIYTDDRTTYDLLILF